MIEDQSGPEEYQDTLDSVRLEAQSISPAEAEKIRKDIQLVVQAFLDLYGDYIPDEIKTAGTATASAPIVTDSESYEGLYGHFRKDNWLDKIRGLFVPEYTPDSKKSLAYIMDEVFPRLFVINQQGRQDDTKAKHLMQTTEPHIFDLAKEHYDMDVDAAKKYVAEYSLLHTIAHEVVHIFQSNQLPDDFSELTALYFAEQTLQHLAEQNKLQTYLKPRAKKYYRQLIVFNELAKQYGEEIIKKITFGTADAQASRVNVFRTCSYLSRRYKVKA